MAEILKTVPPPYWAYFGQRLVDLADIPAGACVLDIGSGRGTSLFPAAQAAGPQGLVVGIEIWDEHVRGMALEIARRGLHNARVMWMDATALGFRENSFDLVLSGFAYVFFSLQDVFPLLRHGGRLALSSWAWQEDSEWMGELVGRLLPEGAAECEGEPVAGDMGKRPRVYARDTPQTLEAKLAAAGFSDCSVLREDKEFLFRDEEEWWSVMGRAGWQSHLETVERLGAGVLKGLKEDAFEMLQGHKDAAGIHYTRSVLFALATCDGCHSEIPHFVRNDRQCGHSERSHVCHSEIPHFVRNDRQCGHSERSHVCHSEIPHFVRNDRQCGHSERSHVIPSGAMSVIPSGARNLKGRHATGMVDVARTESARVREGAPSVPGV